MRLTPVRTLDVERPMASGHAFLSAGSGLVRVGDILCVIADDERCLALFAAEGTNKGTLIELQPGDLPRDAAKRKDAKPDFEILLALPSDSGAGENRLLAMGSGSTDQRMRGVLVRLTQDNEVAEIRQLDLRPLFEHLAPLVPEINMEGAIVDGDRLILFNRGNMQAPASHIVETSLSALIEGTPAPVSLVRQLALPCIDGVPLTVTDACRLADGTTLLATVAEATGDSYADGALAGAAFVLLDAQFGILRVEYLDPPVKIEGVTARITTQDIELQGIELSCVTDADDPDSASMLYSAILSIESDDSRLSPPPLRSS